MVHLYPSYLAFHGHGLHPAVTHYQYKMKRRNALLYSVSSEVPSWNWIPSISGLTRLLPEFIPLSLKALSLQLYQQHLHLVIFLLSCNISIPLHHPPFYSYSDSYLFPAPPIIISQDLPRRTTCNFLPFPKR